MQYFCKERPARMKPEQGKTHLNPFQITVWVLDIHKKEREDKKMTITNSAGKIRLLTNAEAALVNGADRPGISYDADCCHTQGYKTGNWRKVRYGFVTYTETEYFCPSCETFFWRKGFSLFD